MKLNHSSIVIGVLAHPGYIGVLAQWGKGGYGDTGTVRHRHTGTLEGVYRDSGTVPNLFIIYL